MKENSIKNERSSIEEDIKILEEMIENANIENMDMNNCFGGEHIEAIEHILTDYKRVLKENEELLQEKINNQKIIALAQNDMLNYQASFEDGKNRRTSAVQSIIENQQYYIFQKQFEKYEEHIKMLQKENEELNLKYYMLYAEKIENLKAQEVKIKSQVISVQKVKAIINRIDYDIKKTKEIISKNTNIYASYRKNDYQIVRLRAMNTKSLDIKKRLQKLLEGEE